MLETIQSLPLRASYAAMMLVASPKAFAQELFGPVPDIGGVEGGSEESVREGILGILETVLSFMALIAVIFIVIGGIRLVISQGEEQEKDKAKKTIFYVIIGLIVILIAQAIVSFVQDVIVD
ncbi:MAG: TrbC/VirB2 family protein [Candidatus Peribacteraceae bacterium]|jgi:amino acid transporter|nr:TrbC/VirB2 family protein [Candidatus Peribacteraceae bacterium]